MKKIKYILPILGLVIAGSVLAWSGSHEFTGVTVSTSNGHWYKAEFTSTGSFPFNGGGVFDRSKVNLKGLLTVNEKDGVPATESSCFALSGTLKSGGGTIKTNQYADTTCATVARRNTYWVTSYAEAGDGSFTTVAKDSAGVVYTLTGSHAYQP